MHFFGDLIYFGRSSKVPETQFQVLFYTGPRTVLRALFWVIPSKVRTGHVGASYAQKILMLDYVFVHWASLSALFMPYHMVIITAIES